MKRYKKPKQAKYELTAKDVHQIKYDVTREATSNAALFVIAAAQEVKDLNEDEICEIFETANRYAAYLDDNLIKIKDVQRVIEKKSGVKLKGWI